MTIDRGVFPITAQGTSVLFANPALTGYLFVPWVVLTRSPLGAYVFVIALNTLAIWLAYLAAAQLLDARHALIVAFLMAVNPWLIEYSRTTWVQALLPFFVSLIFWLLVPILLGKAIRPGRRIIITLTAIAAMTQTYLLAFVILIPVTLLTLIFRKRLKWGVVAIGLTIFAVVTSIYGLGLAANGTETLDRLRNFSSGQSHLSAEAWSHALRLISGENYAVARGRQSPIDDWVIREQLSEILHYAILAALLIGIALIGYDVARRRPEAEHGLIALIWFAVPILLMSYVSKPVHPFYLLLTLPAGYILAARGLGVFLRWRFGVIMLAAVSIPVAMLLILNVLRFAESTLAHPGAHGLGALPLGTGLELTATLLPSEILPADAVVISDVDEWTLNSFAGKVFPVDRDINAAQTTYIAPGSAVYLLFGDDQHPITRPIGATDVATFDLKDGSFIERDRVLSSAVGTQQAISSDRGISYLGWTLETPLMAGKSATLLTYWRINSLLAERSGWLFGPFVHVYDAAGQRIAIGSGAVVPGVAWRLHDIHIQRITVALPDNAVGPFTLQIGQYDGVHNLNTIFSLPNGTAAATVTSAP